MVVSGARLRRWAVTVPCCCLLSGHEERSPRAPRRGAGVSACPAARRTRGCAPAGGGVCAPPLLLLLLLLGHGYTEPERARALISLPICGSCRARFCLYRADWEVQIFSPHPPLLKKKIFFLSRAVFCTQNNLLVITEVLQRLLWFRGYGMMKPFRKNLSFGAFFKSLRQENILLFFLFQILSNITFYYSCLSVESKSNNASSWEIKFQQELWKGLVK